MMGIGSDPPLRVFSTVGLKRVGFGFCTRVRQLEYIIIF